MENGTGDGETVPVMEKETVEQTSTKEGDGNHDQGDCDLIRLDDAKGPIELEPVQNGGEDSESSDPASPASVIAADTGLIKSSTKVCPFAPTEDREDQAEADKGDPSDLIRLNEDVNGSFTLTQQQAQNGGEQPEQANGEPGDLIKLIDHDGNDGNNGAVTLTLNTSHEVTLDLEPESAKETAGTVNAEGAALAEDVGKETAGTESVEGAIANLQISEDNEDVESPILSKLPLRAPRQRHQSEDEEPAPKPKLHFVNRGDAGHFKTFYWNEKIGAIQDLPAFQPFNPTPLLSKSKWNAIIDKHVDLGQGFEKCIKITDYSAFTALKYHLSLKWMLDSGFIEKIGKGEALRPDFVSSEGRISDVLKTPMEKGTGWHCYAVRFQDMIFLSSGGIGNRGVSTIESYAADVLLKLLTGEKSPTEPINDINEFDSHFTASQIALGDHNLLLVTGKQFLEGEGETEGVKVRAYRPSKFEATFFMRKKFLNYWAVTVVSGAKEFVLAHRDKIVSEEGDSTLPLKAIVTVSPDHLWKKARAFNNGRPDQGIEEQEKCLSFCDRFLSWVKEEMQENDPTVMKLFKWEEMDFDSKSKQAGKSGPGGNWRKGDNNRGKTCSSPVRGGQEKETLGLFQPKERTECEPTPRENKPYNDPSAVCYRVNTDSEVEKARLESILPSWFIQKVGDKLKK